MSCSTHSSVHENLIMMLYLLFRKTVTVKEYFLQNYNKLFCNLEQSETFQEYN